LHKNVNMCNTMAHIFKQIGLTDPKKNYDFFKSEPVKKKVNLCNKECLVCDKELDISLEKTYIKIEGEYCKDMGIWTLDGERLKKFLIYANICHDCFRKINASVDGVQRFKRLWNKRVDKFKDRLF
jgi:hypothetical protein